MKWDILGHEWAVDLLQGHLAADRVRHAYLITGPEGVGRRTLALRFAQALNCIQPPTPGDYCGTCRDCHAIAQQAHPDLVIIQPESHSGILKVDQVRELLRTLFLAPYQARYRVALLLDFERANPNAANALLKTLEEPPDHVILILTAESADVLLPTIVSRCELLRLHPVSHATLHEGLQTRWGMDGDLARLLAHISHGRPGYALHIGENPERLARRKDWLDDLLRLLKAGRVERFDYAEGMAKDRDSLQDMLETWLSFWLDILQRAAGSGAAVINLDRETDIQWLAAQLELQAVHQAITALNRTLTQIKSNVNRRLAAEVLMLDLPRIS